MRSTIELHEHLRRSLSIPRLERYERAAAAAGLVPQTCVDLYLWNARLAAELWWPLHLCEVAIRNAAAEAVSAVYGERWPWSPGFERSLPAAKGCGYQPAADLLHVRATAKQCAQVVVGLKFVFWEKLFTARHEQRLWRSHLSRVFPGADESGQYASRQRIANDLRHVRLLRNRIAHHEPIFQRPILADLRLIEALVGLRCARSARWLRTQQRVVHVLGAAPATPPSQ